MLLTVSPNCMLLRALRKPCLLFPLFFLFIFFLFMFFLTCQYDGPMGIAPTGQKSAIGPKGGTNRKRPLVSIYSTSYMYVEHGLAANCKIQLLPLLWQIYVFKMKLTGICNCTMKVIYMYLDQWYTLYVGHVCVKQFRDTLMKKTAETAEKSACPQMILNSIQITIYRKIYV